MGRCDCRKRDADDWTCRRDVPHYQRSLCVRTQSIVRREYSDLLRGGSDGADAVGGRSSFVFFTVQYTLIVSLEEEYLMKTFGDDYRRYVKAVPRFLPTFKKFPGSTNIQPDLDWIRGIISEKSTLLAITLVTLLLSAYLFLRG